MAREINLDPAVSLYKQIKEAIKTQIVSGKLQKGDKIPSERELCEMFQVSRITARQAIAEAIKEGLLYTVQGKGTFVVNGKKEEKIDQGLVKITSFENSLMRKGLLAATKILNHEIKTVDFALSKILCLDMTNRVLNLELIGLANDEPFVLYQSSFEASLGSRFYEIAKEKEASKMGFSTIDLYDPIEDIDPNYAEQTFEALEANERLAEILEIDQGKPLFLVTSIIYTKNNIPIEFKKAYYRADKYKFHIKRYI